MSSSAEIKEQLLFVSNKIDEAIKQIHESKTQEIHVKQQEEILNDNSPNFIGRITSLKSQVESIQKNLEEVYNIDKVNQLESDIKKKEKMLRELKEEKFILNNVVKEQNKGINEYLSKFDSTKEQKELSDLIKKVKEENHNIKEIYKEMTNKMKEQKNKIDALEKRCKIIKQNIEFQKKKQMKEVQKTSKEEKSDGEEDDYGSDVEKMKEVEKNIINEINIEEKNYRTEINEQMDIIKKLNADISKVNFKIKNLVQEKKMDEIKRKNRMRGRSTTKIQSNQNATKNTQIRDNKRHLSNYKPRQTH
jgi:chromosome segregation ATPase